MVCTADYVEKILGMKKEGMAVHVTNAIVVGDYKESLIDECAEAGIKVTPFEQVIECEKSDVPEFVNPAANDTYMLSYTSGTTGDSKGVKYTHEMIVK